MLCETVVSVSLIVTESTHKNVLGRTLRTGSLLKASLSLSMEKRTEKNMGVGLLSRCNNSQLQVPRHDTAYLCCTGCLLFALCFTTLSKLILLPVD